MTHRHLSLLFGFGLVACANESLKDPSPSTASSAATSTTTAAMTSDGATNSTAVASSSSASTVTTSPTTDISATGTSMGVESDAESEATTVPSYQANGSTEVGLESSIGGDVSTSVAESTSAPDVTAYADGFHELFIHDECTDDNPAEDVCAHARVHEVSFTFGGDPLVTYDVTLRVRGLFEPTTIAGGATPDQNHPYFKVGGTVTKPDYS